MSLQMMMRVVLMALLAKQMRMTVKILKARKVKKVRMAILQQLMRMMRAKNSSLIQSFTDRSIRQTLQSRSTPSNSRQDY